MNLKNNILLMKKLTNSLTPRVLFLLSIKRLRQRNHWKDQKPGDDHGYEKYTQVRPQTPYLIKEVESKAKRNDAILDVGCNCGYYLYTLKKSGYVNLSGVDISRHAIEYGRKKFQLHDANMHIGAFEDVLPELVSQGKKYDLIFSMGATIELVHPAFDIIKSLTSLCQRYVILFIQEWGHTTPRLYEYEFQKQGFLMVKCIRPYDGSEVTTHNLETIPSMLVFQKIH
jgi:SAM-dependent methyltransferase